MGYLYGTEQQVWHCRKRMLFLIPQPSIIKEKEESRMSYESRRDYFICLMFILARIPQRNKSSAMEVIELGCEAGEAVQRARKACSMQISIYMEEVTDDSRILETPKDRSRLSQT